MSFVGAFGLPFPPRSTRFRARNRRAFLLVYLVRFHEFQGWFALLAFDTYRDV